MNFLFLPLRAEDIAILAKWLREPHVQEFWQETEDESELADKFLNLEQRGVTAFIAHLDAKPIAYIQSYEASKVGGGWWPDVKSGVYGVDQFIGEAGLVGKGLGTAMIRQFTDEIFKNPLAKEIITDPDPTNGRAIRAYEKAGFVRKHETVTPGGPAMLMVRERPK